MRSTLGTTAALWSMVLGLWVLPEYQAVAINRSNEPKNLARTHLGSIIKVNPSNPSTSLKNSEATLVNDATLLLSDDKTLTYDVAKGVSGFIINLSVTDVLKEFTFYSYSAAGATSVYTSPVDLSFDSPRWRPASASIPFRSGEAASVALNFAEARYVKVVLDCRQSGKIASFSVFGSLENSDFGARQNRQNTTTRLDDRRQLNKTFTYDYANVYTGSRVIYVSSVGSSSTASSMVDDNPRTYFVFAPTDTNPTAVVEMVQPERIRRVSSLLKAPPGKVEVYILSTLPYDKNAGSPNGVTVGAPIPADFYKSNHPIAATVVTADGRAVVDFQMTSGRYILFRFIPNTPPSKSTALSTVHSRPLFASAQASDTNSVRFYEISAFGDNPQVQFYPYGVNQPSGLVGQIPPVINNPPIIPPIIPPGPTPSPTPTTPPPPPPPPPVSP